MRERVVAYAILATLFVGMLALNETRVGHDGLSIAAFVLLGRALGRLSLWITDRVLRWLAA
jgi:hypothetical protein